MANASRGPLMPTTTASDSSQTQDTSYYNTDKKANASPECPKQRLERERKARLEKDEARQQIVEVCNSLNLGESKDIADIEGILKLCQLLKRLAALSRLKLESDITDCLENFLCLLKLLKKLRYGYCNISTCCEVLDCLLKVSGSPYSTKNQAELLKELSEIWIVKANYDNAIASAEQSAKLASELGDKKLEAEMYYILFKAQVLKGSMEEANVSLEKCINCSKKCGDELTMGYCTFAKATIHYMEQNYDLALTEAESFLEISRRLDNKVAECEAVLQMATIHCTLFNIQKALNLYSDGLELAIEVGHRKKVLETQVNQTSVYSLMGEYRKSYKTGKQMVERISDYEDKALEYTVLCNLSVDALILNKDRESLELAQRSLMVAEQLDAGEPIALAYGNIGLAQEKLHEYDDAIKSYENCLKFGEKIKDTRIINNSYCNLGRAYEGRGDKEIAKSYYLKALNMPEPPSSHWCDTEDFRFSPDYLLAKVAVEENDYVTAKKYFQQVVDRCEKFRKNVHDSPLKICFNDTQKKPFQYLQHVLLKHKADAAALLVGEMGRGRDFYDKVIKEDKSKQLNTHEALSNLAKTNNQAVLFLSKLDVVNEMRMWFIAPDGSVTSYGCPLQEWENVFKDWNVIFSEVLFGTIQPESVRTNLTVDQLNSECSSIQAVQSSEKEITEFRGVDSESLSDEESEGESEDDLVKFGKDENYCDQSKVKPEKATCAHPTDTRGPSNQQNRIREICDLIDRFSELIVRPIEGHIENLASKSDSKPELLIIPQGPTFNIPYSTLRLKNEEPLCTMVSPREAFSFHSYFYSTTLQQEATTQFHRMGDVLIVGNPTNNLKFAEKEAKMIAEILKVTPLLNDYATRSEVLRRLSKAPIIHFACHGTSNGKSLLLSPEQSNTSDEKRKPSELTVEDISNLTIQTNMVVLSACHTARGKISCEGVLGLARAFLMAGAKSVVTALWAVNDNATEKFMSKFYSHLFSEPVVNALSTTMCEMKREKFQVTQWGSFKVLGANVKVFDHFSDEMDSLYV